MKTIKYIFEKLVDNLILPIIVGIILPSVISITSRIQTGSWIQYLKGMPKVVWISFLIFIFLWVIVSLIFKRVRLINALNSDTYFGFYAIPAYGWITIGEFEYKGLIWNIQVPAPSPWREFSAECLYLERVEAETPPRCPKCKTEIEQKHSFSGGYIWNCVACGYKKRSRDSYYIEAKRVEKIVRRELERQHESRNN